MKNGILFYAALLLLAACSRKADLNGAWYVAYGQDNKGALLESTGNSYLLVKNDRAISILDKLGKFEIDTISFMQADSSLTINNFPYIFRLSGDSIILTAKDETQYRFVLKRISGHRYDSELNDDCLAGPYSFERIDGDHLFNIDFISDTILIHNKSAWYGNAYADWHIINFDGLQFIYSRGVLRLLLIETCSGKGVILSDPANQMELYALRALNQSIK